ncbi:hypothetical protein [uncultured Pseudoalteromonas sp.]|uniref:hypothetical protein n=1 Tax=uncultured Pseudoalteromonas sp. TaxID=114053 RepID=UPI002595CC0E|nr:hypothetical protein [uncultured Pseudoalteromonas sp.]
MTVRVDFEAKRFPVAQIHLNKVLDAFIASDYNTLTIVSIDPSLRRCIKQRIAHRELPIELSDTVEEVVISQAQKKEWENAYDEEDYQDAITQQYHLIERCI